MSGGKKMKYKDYREFDREVEKLYEEKKFQDVLDLFKRADEVLPEEVSKRYYFTISSMKAILCHMLGKQEECFNAIEKLINNDYACGPVMMRRLPETQDEKYLKLKEKNEVLINRVQEKAKLKYQVYLPEGYSESNKHPVFFALHGDGMDGNIEGLEMYWKPDELLKQGFIFVYVQSSQVYCHNGYQWNKDINTARKDIKECYEQIIGKYTIDGNCILVGGFSGGAMASVDFAMAEVLPLKGFISLCPGKIPASFTKENAERALRKGIRGVVLEGETDLEPSVQDVVKVFDEIGYPYKYILNKGAGHAFPEDFDEKLEKAVRFILE